MSGTRTRRSEQGAVLVISALAMTALLLIVALVIDLGFTRSDRRGGQAAVDNATAAAGQAYADGDIVAACEDAFEYLALALDAPAFTGQECTTLTTTCNPVSERTVTRSSDSEYQAVVVNPVTSQQYLRAPSAIGAQPVDPANDGAPCDRIGVRLTTTGDSYFGGVAGESERVSSVHAVALIDQGPTELRPINLLVLNRTECEVLTMGGGAQVVIATPTDDPTFPGVIASDSDASDADTCDPDSVLQNNGTGATLTAQGPCGTTPDPFNCGRIELYRAPPGAGSCAPSGDVPACNEGTGAITPNAVPLSSRYTRARVDYRYNCKPTYAATETTAAESWFGEQSIPGCSTATSTTDYIDELKEVGRATTAPAGFQTISGSGCTPSAGPDKNIFVPAGNWFIDCDDFKVQGERNVVFRGGNVIFRNNVTVSSGTLTINRCAGADGCSNTISWAARGDFVESQWSPQSAWTYIGGTLSNSQVLTLTNTAVILGGADSRVDQAGTGIVNWTAPTAGAVADSAGPFDDLALWSEGETTDKAHLFRGGGSSYFEGLFFGGLATFDMAGSGPVNLRVAQFVSDKLNLSGSAVFTMSPIADRSVGFPTDPSFTLIR